MKLLHQVKNTALILVAVLTIFTGNLFAQYQESIGIETIFGNAEIADLFNRGTVLMYQAKFDESAKVFKQVIALNPQTPGVYANLTRVYMGLGKWDEAEKMAYREIEVNPTSATAYNNSGYALSLLVKNDEAITVLKKAIELDPKLSRAYFNLAYAYRSSGMLAKDDARKSEQLAKAETVLKSFLNTHPNNKKALVALVDVAMTAERYEKAVAYSLELTKIIPEDFDAQNTLGIAYLQVGKPAEAVVALEKAVKLKSADEQCRRFLGIALATSGQTEKSITLLKRAASNEPTIYFDLGMAAFYAKRFSDAVQFFKLAVDQNASSVSAIYQLSLSYSLLENREAAMEQYEKLKNVSPQDAEELLQRILDTKKQK